MGQDEPYLYLLCVSVTSQSHSVCWNQIHDDIATRDSASLSELHIIVLFKLCHQKSFYFRTVQMINQLDHSSACRNRRRRRYHTNRHCTRYLLITAFVTLYGPHPNFPCTNIFISLHVVLCVYGVCTFWRIYWDHRGLVIYIYIYTYIYIWHCVGYCWFR